MIFGNLAKKVGDLKPRVTITKAAAETTCWFPPAPHKKKKRAAAKIEVAGGVAPGVRVGVATRESQKQAAKRKRQRGAQVLGTPARRRTELMHYHAHVAHGVEQNLLERMHTNSRFEKPDPGVDNGNFHANTNTSINLLTRGVDQFVPPALAPCNGFVQRVALSRSCGCCGGSPTAQSTFSFSGRAGDAPGIAGQVGTNESARSNVPGV